MGPLLGFYSPCMFFLLIASLLGIASTPLLSGADIAPMPQASRMPALDGLRGFLALAVVAYHGEVMHEWLRSGSWVATSSNFYNALGHGGFAVFFMLTGFLFWSQLLHAQGRPSWIRLYIGRFFRIGPLFYVMVSLLLLFVAVKSGWQFHQRPRTILLETGRWLFLGLFGVGDLNRSALVVPLAGVAWTLQYEWFFYLSLPLLALVARLQRARLTVIVLLLVIVEIYLLSSRSTAREPAGVCGLFLFGMLCGSLRDKNYLARLPNWLGSLAICACLGMVILVPDDFSSPLEQILLAVAFYLVISGSSMFGLLTSRPALRLGDASYGIYLLQGFVLAAVFSLPGARRADQISPAIHWALLALGMILLVCIATAAHTWVELPGIRAGKWAASAIKRRPVVPETVASPV